MLLTRLERLRSQLLWVRAYGAECLRMLGLLPQPERVYREVEDQVVGALPPVPAPASFRQELASKLALIAQHKSSGLIIARPKPYRPGILVGLGAGVLATTVAILVLVFRTRVARRAGL